MENLPPSTVHRLAEHAERLARLETATDMHHRHIWARLEEIHWLVHGRHHDQDFMPSKRQLREPLIVTVAEALIKILLAALVPAILLLIATGDMHKAIDAARSVLGGAGP